MSKTQHRAVCGGRSFSGQGPYGHQQCLSQVQQLRTTLWSLPVYLKHAGYRTAQCGKVPVTAE